MSTIILISGAEQGTSNGLLTGNTGSKIVDFNSGTVGTDIQVLAAAAKSAGYGYRISGSNANIRWASDSIGTIATGVAGFWWRPSTDPGGTKQFCVWYVNGVSEAGLRYNPSTNKIETYGADFTSGTGSQSGTTNPNDWRWIDIRYNASANPHTMSVSIDGVAMTTCSAPNAATTISGFLFGDSSSGQATGVSDYDDLVFSATSGDYPLGEHSVKCVTVDPAGTVTLSGTTGNFQTFTGSTPTKTAWNATTARDAVDERPPNTGASQDGWCQITTAASDYVEMPMTTFTLGGDVPVAGRLLAAVWAQDATGGFLGLRTHNGTTETNLFGANISISGNNTTNYPWVAEMLTLADINTQTEIDALAVRAGFSSDAAPDMGLHAVYVEIAVIPGTGNGAAALDITLGLAATGSRPSQGTSNVSINLGLAATGSRPSQGTANFAINLGLAGTGDATLAPSQGSANFAINLGMAVSGSRPSQGSANVGLTLGMAATGARSSLGSADVGITLALAGVGSDLINKGSANLSVNIEIAAFGAAVSAIIPVRVMTPAEILVGNRNTTFYLDVLDQNDGPLTRLDGVTGGKLEWLSNATVKGGGEITVVDVNQNIDWLSVRLRPVMVIQGLPVQPLGIWLPSETPESWDTGRSWHIKLLDKSTIVDQDTVNQTYGLPAATVVTTAIIALLEGAGITNHAITASTKTLDSDLVWSVGTNKLHIINDLLDLINYFSLFMNFEGQLVGQPYTLPANRPLFYEFLDDENSIYQRNFTRDNDIWSIPNRVTLIGVGDATTAALTATADNVDPLSPYSQPRRGRVIGRTEQGVEAVDQAALDALAQKRLIDLTSPTAGVEIAHAPIPGLAVNQAARFRRGIAGIDARHVVFRTAITLDGKALATSTLREVVDL